MIRINEILSCANQHNIPVENLIFKDKDYRTLEKTFDLKGLENTENIDILSKLQILRDKYNTLKNQLNQYVERHKLLDTSTQNKQKYYNGINRLSIIENDLELYIPTIVSNIQNQLSKLKQLKLDLDVFKEKIEAKTNSIISNIPSFLKSNTIQNLKIGYINNEWKDYNTGCYIDIPSTDILYTVLKIKNIGLNSNITGINSHYSIDGYTRVYIDGLGADLANKFVTLWYLAIIKDNNAN